MVIRVNILNILIKVMNDEVERLLKKFPFFLQKNLSFHICNDQLLEIILDLGRRPEARLRNEQKYLSKQIISWQDLEYITKRICQFNLENRAGIEQTLHRISCIRNRQFIINGLTCRIGRSIFGILSVIRDLLESRQSILILGKPGIGKTTIIREIARILANEMVKRVIIIDTSNEIAGENDIPHFSIGYARRMQVPQNKLQHQIMIEAIENHMPQVIIIDEISTELEILAARVITEKGVQLIGTTHGSSLRSLIRNPFLSELIGGIQYVTISDDEANRRKTQKSILERKAYPTFEIIIEINECNTWIIHENVILSIDLLLKDKNTIEQIRYFSMIDRIQIKSKRINISYNYFLKNTWFILNKSKQDQLIKLHSKRLIIYSYSLSNNLLKEILLKMKIQFILTNEIRKASIIIGLKKHVLNNFKLSNFASKFNIPIYSINYINSYKLIRLIAKFA